MSRIGKKPIEMPLGTNIQIDGQKLTISGPKGQVVEEMPFSLKAEVKEGKVFVSPKNQEAILKKTRSLWGLYGKLISNGVLGVTKGFEKKLEIEGIGYKAATENKDLVLNVGFTHPIKIKCPEGISFLVEKNMITVSGINKQVVGETAARIRKARKAEPYKGKGIKYQGERIRRKEGKKVITSK